MPRRLNYRVDVPSAAKFLRSQTTEHANLQCIGELKKIPAAQGGGSSQPAMLNKRTMAAAMSPSHSLSSVNASSLGWQPAGAGFGALPGARARARVC